jgi:periplasmic protein TonB
MSRRLSIAAGVLIGLALLSPGAANSQSATDPAHAAQALPYPTRTIIDRYASEKPAVSSSWIERGSLQVPEEPSQESAKAPHVPPPLEPPASPDPMPTATTSDPILTGNGPDAMPTADALASAPVAKTPDPLPTADKAPVMTADDGPEAAATGPEETSSITAADSDVSRLRKAGPKSTQLPSKKRVATPNQAVPRSYAATVRSRLASHKPANANLGGAMVSFAIGADGRLKSARVVRSSGNTQADKAALATVRRAAPFPKPPSGKPSVYAIQIGAR